MSTFVIAGTVVSSQDAAPASTAGYGVTASLLREAPLGIGGTSTTVLVPVAGNTRVAPDGSFHLTIGGEGKPVGPVELAVSAPDGTRVATKSLTLDQAAAPQSLRVTTLPPRTIEASEDPSLGARMALSGRVIDSLGRVLPAGLPVVLWGTRMPEGGGAGDDADDAGEDGDSGDHDVGVLEALVITQTHPGGYFSALWPADRLARAEGRVAGKGPVPVPLDEEQRLPRHILLVLDLSGVKGADRECLCDEPAPRAPDQADLTANPAAFSQDLGAACADLTVPNRTVEEFMYRFVVRTSEPKVKGITLGGRQLVPAELLGDLLGVALASDALRARLLTVSTATASGAASGAPMRLDAQTARHLVRSDLPPSVMAIARASWLSEVTQTKDVIDAALREVTGRAVLDAGNPIDWDDTPTIHQSIELAHGHVLHMREVWRADGFSLGDLLYSLPLAPLQRRRIAVVDWERRTASARAESLEFEEHLEAFLGRDRDISELVGTRLHEETAGGSRSTTWGVAGGIGAGFVGTGFGIFGGVAGGAGGSDARAWQRSSRTFAADSLQRLRDRVTQRASSLRDERSTVVQSIMQGETVRAETEVVANYNRCHAVTVQYFEVLRHFLVSHELADVTECLFVPLPMTEFDRGKALRWREPLLRYLRDRSLAGGFAAIRRVADNWVGWDYPESRYSQQAPESLEGELRISFVLPRPRDSEDGRYQVDMWAPWRWLLPVDTLELWTAHLNERAASERDRYFRTEVAPQIAARLVQRLRFEYVVRGGGEVEVPLDPTLVSRYVEGVPLYITLSPRGAVPPVPREDVNYFKIWYDGDELPADARVIVHSGKVRYRSPYSTGLLFSSERILDDLRTGDPVVVPTPTSRAELRDPRAEDRDLADRLVAHLNGHLEYYHQAIWASLDAQRRHMLLDSILVPGPEGRSVASVCSNELIGIVGNTLVLPLAPGQRLDPTIDSGDGVGEPAELIDAYTTNPLPPTRVSVPTRGVYAEAVSGECSACEQIDDTRYWRWSTDGLPEPPELSTVSTGTRATDAPDLTPTPLPSPLVSIQNAPEAPAPAGLADAFGLLATKELFKDITGLEATQKNAMAAFEASMSAASALGAEAATLAGQNELGRNASRMLDRIDRARADGLLTPGAAQELTHSALQGLVGEARPPAAPPASDPAVKNAIDQAAQSPKAEIKVSSPAETVEVSFDDSGPKLGAAPAIGQIDLAEFVNQDAVFDPVDFFAPPGQRTHTVTRIATVAGLRGRVGPAHVAAMTGAGLMQANPADATKFQVMRRMRIVYPADPKDTSKLLADGPLPVVVLVHGNARPTIASHEGFTYLQEDLASHGVVSVSVDTNFANAIDSNVVMRAETVLGALDGLRAMDADSSSKFHKRLDLDRVGLMGHSRGGDAVVHAAVVNATRPAATRYGIRAVCSLAPTDFTGTAPPASVMRLSPAHTPFYLVVYGALDGDVAGFGGAASPFGTGFRHYDRATTQKAMVFLDGCCHNRFNDIWTTDDPFLRRDPQGNLIDANRLLSRNAHRTVAREYIGGLFRWRLLGSSGHRALFDGTTLNSISADASIQWSFGGGVTVLDDFEQPAPPAGTRVVNHGQVSNMGSVTVGGDTVGDRTNHQAGVLVLDPNIPAPLVSAYRLDLPATRRDWTGYDLLTFRVCADADVTSEATVAASELPDFTIVLSDTAGGSATVTATSLRTTSRPRQPVFHEARNPFPPPPTENCTALRLETLAVDLATLSGVDRSKITSIAVTPPLGFAVHQFLDSLELIKR